MTLLDMLGATPVSYYLVKLRGWVLSGLHTTKQVAGGSGNIAHEGTSPETKGRLSRVLRAQRSGLVEDLGSHVREEQHIPDRR